MDMFLRIINMIFQLLIFCMCDQEIAANLDYVLLCFPLEHDQG